MPSDGLTSFKIEGFAGLDLRDDPEEAAGAIDLSNVDFDRHGRVRQRDGFTVRKTLAASQPALGPIFSFGGQLLFGAKSGGVSSMYAIDSTYATLATQSIFSVTSGVPFGSATTLAFYFADIANAVYRWDGSAFSAPAGIPKAAFLGVQKPDNRLVLGYVDDGTGAAGFSKVAFSDAGAPETFTANNYVRVYPNDGEFISAITSWRDMLFVFKQSKFFVFYGNSTHYAADGTLVNDFNYRTIEQGRGCSAGSGFTAAQAVPSPEGVYFLDRTGIWLTTGGPAVKISEAIDPIFSGQPTPFFAPVANSTGVAGRLAYIDERLYFFATLSGGIYVFVFDPRLKAWSVWTLGGGIGNLFTGAGWSATTGGFDRETMVCLTTSTPARLVQLDTTVATDNGSAISSYYRSGFFDLDKPGLEKTIRQTELVGQGTVAFSWSRDMATSMNSPSAANVTLGTAPATARGLHRNADYGELLSYKIASVSGGAWVVDRVEPMVQGTRGAGAFS